MSFFDKIADVAIRDIMKARENADAEAFADIIEAFSTLLGRAIATATQGDAAHAERLMQGCENYIAMEVGSFTETLEAVGEMFAAARAHQKGALGEGFQDPDAAKLVWKQQQIRQRKLREIADMERQLRGPVPRESDYRAATNRTMRFRFRRADD